MVWSYCSKGDIQVTALKWISLGTAGGAAWCQGSRSRGAVGWAPSPCTLPQGGGAGSSPRSPLQGTQNTGLRADYKFGRHTYRPIPWNLIGWEQKLRKRQCKITIFNYAFLMYSLWALWHIPACCVCMCKSVNMCAHLLDPEGCDVKVEF